MTRTRPLHLALLAAFGLVVGFAVSSVLVMRGSAVFVPPLSLAGALVLIAVVLLLMARPVRQAAAGERRIDPFYATRVVVLAQSSAFAGAVLAGGSAGIVLFLLTRAVVSVGSTLTAAGTVVAALALVAAALVVEHWCSLPPDDPTEETAS